ncbi:MAG: sensor histidine kinase N-terminal domain-containing protein, partial [Betaproteobacteria bacterium]
MLWLKRWQTYSGWSLRRTLLTVLLPGMLLVVSAQMALTWRSTLMAADAAYDRSLFGAIRAIDASISTESGGLAMKLPYRTLELFELTASGRVHFRLLTEDGLVEIGDPAMPLPEKLPLGQPVFQDAVYQDTSIRLGTYKRLLDRPLAGQTERQAVIIQVAEPLTPRETFTQQLVVQVVSRDILLVGVGCLLIVFAIAWSLQPLVVLRQQVLSRSPSDLSLLQAPGVPSDVQPLILALNQHLERIKTLLEDRRRFIDDASHQLRTPLATLTTQLSYALRESDAVKQKEALFALRAQLEETVRQTNQMLALARADSAGLSPQSFDLVVFVQRICRGWWSSARQCGVNLDLDMDESLQR